MEDIKDNKEQVQEPNYKDLYIRLLADTQNQKRRNEALYQNAWSAGVLDTIKNFIDVYNNVVTGIDYDSKDSGAKLLYKLLIDAFANIGVEIIYKKDIINTQFDVNIMDAVTTIPVNNPELNNCVIDVIKDGFKYNNNMVQFAQVVVGKYL